MSSPFSRTHALDGGPTVHLRLARRSDLNLLLALLARRSVDANALEVLRLLSFDPALRAVACAFAPIDGRETLVGLGAIDLHPGAELDTLVVDERMAGGLGALLGETLRRRAEGRSTHVA